MTEQSNNILITGAAGFIGSNLVHYFLEKHPNWKIWALDLLTYAGNLENLSEVLDSPQLEFVRLDICDSEGVQELFEQVKFDFVFHLAAESHVDRSILSASEFVKTNVVGTQNLLSSALATSVQRFIHISTDEVYGSLGPTGRFVESTPLDPTSPYAASKAASDLMVLAFHKTHGLDTIITRCTNNYGPYQFPEKFIPLFTTNAIEDRSLPLYGDGSNVRSWIHVTDHCRALDQLALGGEAGEVYNIGGFEEAEISNKDMCEQILAILDKPSSLVELVEDRLAHDHRYAVDASKIKSTTGWEPQIALEDGLRATVDWYLNNRDWWEKVKSGEYKEYYQQQYGGR